VTLKTAVQRRPDQVRDHHLQAIEVIVEREQRAAAEGDDYRFVLNGTGPWSSALAAQMKFC